MNALLSLRNMNVKLLISCFFFLFSAQCLPPIENCDSLSVDNIMAMMMNKKVSTQPLVVVDDLSHIPGQ